MRLLRDEMKPVNKYIFIILFALVAVPLKGQTDEDPPVSPVFNFVAINQGTGNTEMRWSRSPSPDVAGYVVYLYQDPEGYAIDTILRSRCIRLFSFEAWNKPI